MKPSTPQTELELLIKSDLARRQGKEGYELCNLASVEEHKRWDFSLPTLYDNKRTGRKKFSVRNQATFNQAFASQFPEFGGVDLIGMGFVAAGGSISQLLQANGKAQGDVDLFLHQERRNDASTCPPPQTPEDATRRVLELARILVANFVAAKKLAAHQAIVMQSKIVKKGQTEPAGMPAGVPESCDAWEPDSDVVRGWFDGIECVRCERCATLSLGGRRYQFIFRLYRSVAEILYGFDVHSSAAGYDGVNVRMTPLCRFAHEYGVNVVDLTRRSTTLEKRLLKYWERGFDMVLPELDVSRVPNRLARYGLKDVCELPFMSFSYKKVRGNRIRVAELLSSHWPRSTADPIASDKLTALDVVRNRGGALEASEDYAAGVLESGGEAEFQLSKSNLYRLARNQEDTGLFYYDTGRHYERALLGVFDMPVKTVDSAFRTLRKDILRGHDTVRHVCLFFGEDKVAEVMDALYVRKVPVLACLDSLLGGLEKSVREKIAALQNSPRPIAWNVQDPTTQLVGSFNPIFADSSDWYGYYHSKKA